MIAITRAIVRSCGQQQSRRVFVIGLDGAGKSALVNKVRILSHEFALVPLRPTVGQNLSRVHRKGLQLEIWDLGGQRRLRHMWNSYFPQSDVLIFVIDASDQARLEEAVDLLVSVMENPETLDIPVIVSLNKSDLPSIGEAEFIERYLPRISAARTSAPHEVHVVSTVCDLDMARRPSGIFADQLEQALLEYGQDQREGLEQVRADAWPGIGVDEVVDLLEKLCRSRNSREDSESRALLQ